MADRVTKTEILNWKSEILVTTEISVPLGSTTRLYALYPAQVAGVNEMPMYENEMPRGFHARNFSPVSFGGTTRFYAIYPAQVAKVKILHQFYSPL